MADPLLLEVKGLHAGYGRAEVLSGLDFQLAPGQVVTVIGPNGAGKSTLLRAATGMIPTTAGRVRLDGRELTRSSIEDTSPRPMFSAALRS